MAVKKVLQSTLTGGSEKEEQLLRRIALPVVKIDNKVKKIIEDLHDTLWAYPFCVGLSATQIGYPYAISIVNPKREKPEDDLILINPKILSSSGKKNKKRESCMSVWGQMGEVERRDIVLIEYQDVNLNTNTLQCSGFDSRCIQHEIDHLNGTLYFDKLTKETQMTHAEFFDEFSIIES